MKLTLRLLSVSVLIVLCRCADVTTSITDISLEVVSRYGVKPGKDIFTKFDAAASLELGVSAKAATNVSLGYYDYGYGVMPADNSTSASFRQTYGDVTGFLEGRAITKYIEASFTGLTLPSHSTDLFLVGDQHAHDAIGKMGFPWNMVQVFVLQNYSYVRPSAFRLTPSFVGRSSYVEVLDEVAFDELMEGIVQDARSHRPGVIGLGVSFYHTHSINPFQKKQVFAHLREAFASPFDAEVHFNATKSKGDFWGVNAYSTVEWTRTYASGDEMPAMKAVTPDNPVNEFYTLSGHGVTPMVWAN